MTITDLFVLVYDYGGNNNTLNELVNNKVYTSIEEAEKDITNKSIMRVIDLEDWSKENYDSGYISAYG